MFSKYSNNHFGPLSEDKFLFVDQLWHYDLERRLKEEMTGNVPERRKECSLPGCYYELLDAVNEKERKETEVRERARLEAIFIMERDKQMMEMGGHPLPKSLDEWKPVEEMFHERLGKARGIIAAAAAEYYHCSREHLTRVLKALKAQAGADG